MLNNGLIGQAKERFSMLDLGHSSRNVILLTSSLLEIQIQNPCLHTVLPSWVLSMYVSYSSCSETREPRSNNLISLLHQIVVMGHYGCGGVAAAIASSPRENIDAASNTVQTWIDPIRQLYLTSDREEIVSLRTANLALEANGTEIGEPEINEPGKS